MADLCTLAALKTALAITDTSEDTNLTRLITATSDDFLTEIDRQDLIPQVDYTEYVRRHRHVSSGYFNLVYPFFPSTYPHHEVWLLHYPINSITSVTVNGTALTAVTDPSDTSASGYWLDDEAFLEDRQKFILINQPFSYPFQTVVEYNAGYDEIPAAISEAVIDWVSFRRGLEQIHRIVQTGGASISAGTVTVSSTSVDTSTGSGEIPGSVARVIERYRRMSI